MGEGRPGGVVHELRDAKFQQFEQSLVQSSILLLVMGSLDINIGFIVFCSHLLAEFSSSIL